MKRVIYICLFIVSQVTAFCQDEGMWIPMKERFYSSIWTFGDIQTIYYDDSNLYVSGAFRSVVKGNDTVNVMNFAWRNNTSGKWETDTSIPNTPNLAYDMITYGDYLYIGGPSLWTGTETVGVMVYKSGWGKVGIDYPNYGINTLDIHLNILYAGGGFVHASLGRDIAKWNDTVWSSVGGGMGFPGTDHVDAMVSGTIGGKHRLFVGGSFERAGYGTPGWVEALNLAQWDGQTWDSVNSVWGQYVSAMTIDTINRNFYISGGFYVVDTVDAVGIAMWDGIRWYPVGGDINCEASRNALLVYHGELYLGSCITQAGNLAVKGIARWNGREWRDLSGNSCIYCGAQALAVYKDTLFVGGMSILSDTTGGDTIHYALAKWYTPPCAYLEAGIQAEVTEWGKVVFTDSSAGLWKSSWWWDFGDGVTDTTKDPVHQYTTKDTYAVMLVVGYDYPDGTQCRDTAYRTIKVTGIPETVPSKPSITIIPNPSHYTLTVKVDFTHKPNDGILSMFNVAGQMVKQYPLRKQSNKIEINTTTLARGIYLFTVEENGKMVMEKKAVVE